MCIVAFLRVPVLLTLYRWVPEINSLEGTLSTGHTGKCRRLRSHWRQADLSPGPASRTVILTDGQWIPFFSFGRETVSMTGAWT